MVSKNLEPLNTESLSPPLLNEVAEYYTSKLRQHGETPQGVDWNGEDSQGLRFRQLCRIIEGPEHFTINDLGCGYGALHEFMSQTYPDFSYTGIDISQDMITSAKKRHAESATARFVHAGEPDKVSDYGVASGIFNVRMKRSDEEWRLYMKEMLDVLDRTSTKGFAFNCLTAYSDADKMRDYLYYADPAQMFDLCKNHYSRQVALLHDYGLYEFTILVRKS